MKMRDEPHANKSEQLKNGFHAAQPSPSKPCGAKTRRATLCLAPSMKNGRCRMHGGLSTGPKTKEGLELSKKARWKHGKFSFEKKEERRQFQALIKKMKNKLRELKND